MSSEPKIHLAFRFHGNFYHSYRGDTPDELGFGKDIRIIRRIIEVFDKFNAGGIPARATWDIENYFSFEKIMPEHCPDIIESLQRRVAEGLDEVQVMSYNNGLLTAHTAWEFDKAIGRAISNSAGSGVKDLFKQFGPMVRPQEMMFTPYHLKMYPAHRIESVSLFYSAIPFNAFSNFIKPFPFEQLFNPMTLRYPGISETMTLVPARNHGDIADNISLRWWLKRLRRRQLALSEPIDLLLLIDADADDEYWYGFDWPVVSKLLASAQGIKGLIDSVADLDFVVFATPSEYVQSHSPIASVTIGQDTADGSFDGYASWAEKWSNHQLWTGIERSRIIELQALRLMKELKTQSENDEIERLVEESREARLKSLSTTHFGLSTPVMNLTRLGTGTNIVREAVDQGVRAFELAANNTGIMEEDIEDQARFSLIDYVRGVSTETNQYLPKPSRALVRIPLSTKPSAESAATLTDADGKNVPSAVRPEKLKGSNAESGLMFVTDMDADEKKDFRLVLESGEAPGSADGGLIVEDGAMRNDHISLRFDDKMRPESFVCSNMEMADGAFLRSAINYADTIREVGQWSASASEMLGDGLVGIKRLKSEIPFEASGEKRVSIERDLILVSGLPYLYVDTRVVYPFTRSNKFSKEKARKLQQEYDGYWREVMPCELRPALFGKPGKPLRVWKHDYLGQMSYYDLNYGEFSKNAELDSFNNHITNGWIAITDGEQGLLVAQTADVNSSFAFCPMRTRETSKGLRIFLNPFGSYFGRQLQYITSFSGIGIILANAMGESLNPLAISYNGRTETFSLMIAPYLGDEPPEEIRRDAEAFAYPYAIVSRSKIIGTPEHRQWSFTPGKAGD